MHEYRIGCRCVLNEFHEIVSKHHASRRGRDVAPDLERRFVRHACAESSARRVIVREQIRQPVDEVLAAGSSSLSGHLGIGQREVGRRYRVDELTRHELELGF